MLFYLLAELDRDEALAKGYWNLAMIILVALLTVVFLVAMFVLRRWKRRQLLAIEQDREQRRAGQASIRVDAWQASSDRYVDRDKLSEDDLFSREEDSYDEDEGEGEDQAEPNDRDPFGLFDDKPYQEADDDDDFDEDEDWDDEDEQGHGR